MVTLAELSAADRSRVRRLFSDWLETPIRNRFSWPTDRLYAPGHMRCWAIVHERLCSIRNEEDCTLTEAAEQLLKELQESTP